MVSSRIVDQTSTHEKLQRTHEEQRMHHRNFYLVIFQVFELERCTLENEAYAIKEVADCMQCVQSVRTRFNAFDCHHSMVCVFLSSDQCSRYIFRPCQRMFFKRSLRYTCTAVGLSTSSFLIVLALTFLDNRTVPKLLVN